MSTVEIDPRRCPICGRPNECSVALGKSGCWCFSLEISDDVLEKIPEEAREQACICKACASGGPRIPKAMELMREILRRRG